MLELMLSRSLFSSFFFLSSLFFSRLWTGVIIAEKVMISLLMSGLQDWPVSGDLHGL